MNILLVEDNPADARLIREILKEVGGAQFNVECAESLAKGLKRTGEKAFDMMLLDLNLPDSRGLDTLRRMNSQVKEAPIVVLTHFADEATSLKAIQAGAQDYLIKGQMNGDMLVRSMRYAIERKRAEAVRKRAEAHLRLQSAALESAANAIVIIDRKGCITWVNPAFVRLTGYTSEETLGRNLRLLKSGKHDQAFYRNLWQTILAGQVWHGEIINRRKDGSLYTEEQTITPVCGECGEIEHFIAIKQDITQRKRAEEGRARLRAILEATIDCVGIADIHEKVIYLNSGGRKLLGIGEDEDISNLGIADSHPEWARKLVLGEAIPAAIRDGAWSGETALLSRDGREIPVSQVIQAHKAPDGTVEFLSTIARDITERKRFEAQLEATVEARTRELQATNARLQEATRQAEEASIHKSQFLANMSHELRTPLNSILGFAELLQDPQFGPITTKQARYLGHISQSGQHLLALINDLLDLSKVEAGRLELRPEAFPLAEALTAALDPFRIQVDAKGVTLTLQVDQAPEILVADPLRVKQILYNLVSNAVKFTPPGGAITVTARRGSSPTPNPYPPTPDDCVAIAVSDTGIGIKTEDLSRLFQEFTQLDSSFAKPQQGTGLGLALTKRLVELHGGTITVTSPGEGQGSTFTITLPLRPLGTRERILVVEEDAPRGVQLEETSTATPGAEAHEVGQ